MDPSAIARELESLRTSYVGANLRQRLNIAIKRARHRETDPNRVIAYVTAVEGFSRSLCMHLHGRGRTKLLAVYPKYRDRGAVSLITEYLKAREFGTPAQHFGEETWRLFVLAVEYRHLLVHECTYLGLPRSRELIQASAAILRSLARERRLEFDEI